MIKYTFQIEEMDAEKHQAPKQDDEDNEEYADRLAASIGNHYFRVVVQESESKQFVMLSPYFEKDSSVQKWTVFNETMRGIEAAVKTVEKVEKNAEPSKLILEGTEAAFNRLRARN